VSGSREVAQPKGTLQSVLAAYQASSNFAALAPRTRADYVRQIKRIEAEFSDFPLAALTDRRTHGEFMAWRDRLAVKSRRQADYAFSVLAFILAWAFDRGLVLVNPCERSGKVYRSKRIESIWTPEDEAAFMAKAPEHLRLAFMLAIWAGRRQGDLLRLPWTAYDGTVIRLRPRQDRRTRHHSCR
jgi:integrase